MAGDPAGAGPADAVPAAFRLTGKVALVTGGSRGLGRAVALAFAEAGADVAVVSRRPAACEHVAAEIRAIGRRAIAVPAHVGRWDQLPGLVDAVQDGLGRIDVLVNNAGSSPPYDALADVSEAMFDSVLNLNFTGPVRLAVLVAERMRAAGGGAIVNISSLSAVWPEAGALPYAAAKMALDVATAGLAAEYAPTVRVNSIRPGSFRTDVSRHWPPGAAKRYAQRVALGRLADPHEIVGAVLYLASDASSFTTGATISVDGGPR